MPRSIPTEDSQRPIKQLIVLAGEFWEPFVAVLGGLGLAVAGLLGTLTGDKLTAATLLILSAVAGSLLRERALRVTANRNVEEIGRQLDETTNAVNAIHSGNPYSVLEHNCTWDIVEPDGSLVVATRTKKIRFDQNNVVSLYDFSSGDGIREVEYFPKEIEAVKEFLAEGQRVNLVALGHVYYRGNHLTFTVRRTTRNGFMQPHESVAVVTKDATELMHLKVQWPANRPPTALRLGRATPSQDWRNEDVLDALEIVEGRPTYTKEIPTPEKGGMTTIEWEWGPAPIQITSRPKPKPTETTEPSTARSARRNTGTRRKSTAG